jgi:prepilin-type N-terminal cleavage/methylation domain-containing protein/prepilin-type processing-associated H-X9-DG protein
MGKSVRLFRRQFRRCPATVTRLRPLSQNASRWLSEASTLLKSERLRATGGKDIDLPRHASSRRSYLTRHPPSVSFRLGFTLIELLVVIALLSILAAVLFPVFAKAREKARQVVCASNLRQLVLAWQMYAQDYDEMACPSYNAPDGVGDADNAWDFHHLDDGRWTTGILGAYTNDGRIHGCPDNPFPISADNRPYNGYAYNATYIGGDLSLPSGSDPACHLLQIVYPAQTVVFADAGYSEGDLSQPENFLRAPSETTTYLNSGNVDFRHTGVANVAYADVHVEHDHNPYDPKTQEFGWLSADDSAYGPGMQPASAFRY